MFKKLFSRFFSQPAEPLYFHVDMEPWENHHAHELHAFFKTPVGDLFLKQLKKHQMDVNEWAVDTSQEAYDNMKYRGCVAYGTKLQLDKILSMSRPVPLSKNKDLPKEAVDKWFAKRMGMYKPS